MNQFQAMGMFPSVKKRLEGFGNKAPALSSN